MEYFNQEKIMVSLTGDDIIFGEKEWWAEYNEDHRPYLNIPINCYFDVKSVLGIDISDESDTILEMSFLLYMDTREVCIDMWLSSSEFKLPEYILFELTGESAELLIQAATNAAKRIFNMSLDAVYAMDNAATNEIVLLLEDVVMSIHIRDNGDDSDGWDHTIYDLDGDELDGGVYNNTDSILADAFAQFKTWYDCTKEKYVSVLPLTVDDYQELIEDGQIRKFVESHLKTI